MQEWLKSPEGRNWQVAVQVARARQAGQPYFTASVDQEGIFRIDDVPPGAYVLRVRFSEHAAGRISDHRFVVPQVEQDKGTPFELGVLKLE